MARSAWMSSQSPKIIKGSSVTRGLRFALCGSVQQSNTVAQYAKIKAATCSGLSSAGTAPSKTKCDGYVMNTQSNLTVQHVRFTPVMPPTAHPKTESLQPSFALVQNVVQAAHGAMSSRPHTRATSELPIAIVAMSNFFPHVGRPSVKRSGTSPVSTLTRLPNRCVARECAVTIHFVGKSMVRIVTG